MEIAHDIASCLDDTGLDPHTLEGVDSARHLHDRKLQRAWLPSFKPENDFEVRQALLQAGRADLLGSGCDALIPANPPKAALQARRERSSNALAEGRFVRAIPNQEAGADGSTRKSARRRTR
jgi:hypothetical protein